MDPRLVMIREASVQIMLKKENVVLDTSRFQKRKEFPNGVRIRCFRVNPPVGTDGRVHKEGPDAAIGQCKAIRVVSDNCPTCTPHGSLSGGAGRGD
jgi:hypothetical protein